MKKVKPNSDKKYIDPEIRIPQDNPQKIKWSGKKAHLGFIIGTLADNGYIDAPKKPDGEINYSEFARLLLKHFDCHTTPESLAKYLNTISEKSQEVERNFSNNDFKLPHSKRVS